MSTPHADALSRLPAEQDENPGSTSELKPAVDADPGESPELREISELGRDSEGIEPRGDPEVCLWRRTAYSLQMREKQIY